MLRHIGLRRRLDALRRPSSILPPPEETRLGRALSSIDENTAKTYRDETQANESFACAKWCICAGLGSSKSQ